MRESLGEAGEMLRDAETEMRMTTRRGCTERQGEVRKGKKGDRRVGERERKGEGRERQKEPVALFMAGDIID
jgi:hypothetical protein